MTDNDVMPIRLPYDSELAGSEAMIRNPDTGQVHFLNPTASLVWDCCDGSCTLAQCRDRLRERFSVPEGANVTADIEAAVGQLRSLGLLA